MKIERVNVDCPYSSIKDESFWRKSISDMELDEINPMSNVAFTLTLEDKIASAGSCFAQHISRYLIDQGYEFITTEKPHPFVPANKAEEYNYGVYPARFGNIYTSRQLLQLIQRAYGKFEPTIKPYQQENIWLDPFRPFIQPNGFIDQIELEMDRKQHLESVRIMFESLDVFIFTLGLTECWENIADGSILPVCPGCGAGKFDQNKFIFRNLNVEDVKSDLREFIELLNNVNPNARIIFTVSPVPLIATFSEDHVLHATTYSKSVLRVAVQEIRDEFENIDYFPSYEIITSSASRGKYFHKDLRNVLETGVHHVMKCFFKAYMNIELEKLSISKVEKQKYPGNEYNPVSQAMMDVVCEEEYLDQENEED
jgi:hypothetical protein